MLPNSLPPRKYDEDDDWAVFKIMRDEQREKRERRRQGLAAEIDALVAAGRARRLTEFHVRIDGVLDYFPSTGKWHDLRNNTRGTSDPTKGIPYKRFGLNPPPHPMSEIKLTKRLGLTPKQKLQMVKFNAGDVGITADPNVLRCLLEKGMIYQSEIDRRARPVYKLTLAGLAYCKKHFTTNPDTK